MQSYVSIIALSYNNWKYYKECLDSILMQDYSNIEIIFSDDGSIDFNKKEVESYINGKKKNNISNVIVNYNEKNLGTVKNLNKMINLSKGKYIKLLAVDDKLYEKETVSKLVKHLEETNSVMCQGYAEIYDENMEFKIGRKPSSLEAEIMKKGNRDELYKMICISGRTFIAPSRFYSRKFFNEFGLYDEDYVLMEDRANLARVIRKGGKISFIDEVVAKYRDGGISGTGKTNPQLELDKEVFFEKEVFPHLGVEFNSFGRNIVVWGTSTKYLDNKEKMIRTNFKYFIDSNTKVQGKELDGRNIFAPEKVLEENKKEVFIVVCSSSYTEIENWLDENGFKERENYINVAFLKA